MKLTFVFILLSGATLQIVNSQYQPELEQQTQADMQASANYARNLESSAVSNAESLGSSSVSYAESLGSSVYNSALNGLSWITGAFYGPPPSPMIPVEDSLKNSVSSTSETVKNSISSTSATIKNDMPDIPDSLKSTVSQTSQSMKSTESYASNKMNDATNYAGDTMNNAENDMPKIRAQINS